MTPLRLSLLVGSVLLLLCPSLVSASCPSLCPGAAACGIVSGEAQCIDLQYGSCLSDSDCPLQVGFTLTCFSMFCIPTQFLPPPEAATCYTDGGDSGCQDGEVCSKYISAGGTCVPARGPLAPCTGNSDCDSGQSLTCTAGYCLPGSGGSDAEGITCHNDFDCPAQMSCNEQYGFCLPFEIPSFDCRVEDVYQCSGTETCLYGMCVPGFDDVACAEACGPGLTCNSHIGICVADANPGLPDCSSCPSGSCIAGVFPGQPVSCLTSTTCDINSDCNEDQLCAQHRCVPCYIFCNGPLSDLFGPLLAGGGFDPDVILETLSSGNLDPVGAFTATVGSLYQLPPGFSMGTFTFPAGATSTGAQISQGDSLSVGSMSTSSGSTIGQALLEAAASLTTAFDLVAASALTVAMAPSAVAQMTSVTATSLSLSGPLNIIGDHTTSFSFPSSAASSVATGAGSVQVSGGVNLQGSAGSVPINIVPSSTGAAELNVAGGTLLEVGSALLNPNGAVNVLGTLTVNGPLVEPELRLLSGSRVSIAASDSFTTTLGDVSFVGSTGNLDIHGTEILYGNSVFMSTLQSCPDTLTLSYYVSAGQTAAAAIKSGFTAFHYGVDSPSSSFACTVQVCDASECIVVQNPTSTGRRLLAVEGSASWKPTSLYISGRDLGSAAPLHASMGLLLAAAIAAIAAMRL